MAGIPFDEVMQAALIPVAYTIGTDFRPAAAIPWTRWSTGPVVDPRSRHVETAKAALTRSWLGASDRLLGCHEAAS